MELHGRQERQARQPRARRRGGSASVRLPPPPASRMAAAAHSGVQSGDERQAAGPGAAVGWLAWHPGMAATGGGHEGSGDAAVRLQPPAPPAQRAALLRSIPRQAVPARVCVRVYSAWRRGFKVRHSRASVAPSHCKLLPPTAAAGSSRSQSASRAAPCHTARLRRCCQPTTCPAPRRGPCRPPCAAAASAGSEARVAARRRRQRAWRSCGAWWRRTRSCCCCWITPSCSGAAPAAPAPPPGSRRRVAPSLASKARAPACCTSALCGTTA